MSDDSTTELAAYAAAVDVGQLPTRVIDKVKACALYGLAVGVAAINAEQPHRAAAATSSGPGGATRLVDGRACDPDAATFANAVLMHSRCQEDAHPAGHIGVVVLAAAIAAAEERKSSGDALLSAIVAGYEVALRIGRDHERDLSARGFRTTPAYGVFGAAAAVGRLLGLPVDGMVSALGIAASNACGLREFASAGTDEFPYHAGFAARSGATCARLAALGSRGAPTALTGRAGFFRAFASDSPAYGARLADNLGEQFEIEAIGYKPFPTCQYHRGIVRGARQLAAEARAAELIHLDIRMHPSEADFIGVRYFGPFESFPQTFMSAPFCASLSWVEGGVTLAGMHRFANPAVLELVSRVSVIADESRQPYHPRLAAALSDGRSLDWEETACGDAYLLDWHSATRMGKALMSEVGVPRKNIDALIAAAGRLDSGGNAADLMRAVVGCVVSVTSNASPNSLAEVNHH